MLDLEKYESGKQQLSLSENDLREFMNECTESVAELIRHNELKLSIQIDPQISMVVFDRDKMTQVLINLLSNAIKFTEPKKGKIDIKATIENNAVKIIVCDNGKGIPQAYQKAIFDKFYQADNQTLRKPKGSGLGLPISKKIVNLHGGEINVISELNEGSYFYFTIPLSLRELLKEGETQHV